MHTPDITVVIASYNHGPWIQESIESVLAQQGVSYELLVLDDGSRDDSPAIIERLAKQHGFYFERQANMGLAKTLNKALSLAKGRYFVPFGSDDRMRPNRLALQLKHMDAHPELVLSAGNIHRIDGKGNSLPSKKQRHYPARELDFADVFLTRKPGAPAPTLFFRMEPLREIGGFHPSIRLEDLYIELKLTHIGGRIGVLEDTLADYRMHESNTYRNLRFMHDNVLQTYTEFSTHPAYAQVKKAFLNSLLRKAAKHDKPYAKELLKELGWQGLTLRNFSTAAKVWLTDLTSQRRSAQ